jgi:ribosome-binding ATPase YchF (GTP1/OBG family)
MGKIKSQQNNMNLNFIDEFDLEKVKMLYCMSNEELLLCTNYKDYSQEDNNKYVNNIKSSLKKLILNDSNKINRIYQKKKL